MKRSIRMLVMAALIPLLLHPVASAQEPASHLNASEVEQFLHTAKMGATQTNSVGVASSERAWMDDGSVKHRGHIATVDVYKASFVTDRGTEFNFKDTWKFNVAAYELAKLLNFSMVPPSVERIVTNRQAAVTWWIDDATMYGDYLKKKLHAPDLETFNNQMYAVRVFNQLIYNTDANLTNLLITNDWNVWMIDHTRAFRTFKKLENAKNLVKCDRTVLANLRELTKPQLKEKLGKWLTGPEIDGLLARRDLIVKFFDSEIRSKGESDVLFDLQPRNY
jgi:hypothetical protein